jgi:hypothetical protein
LRAHPRVAAVLSRLRAVCESLPVPARFAGRIARSEVLLWPPEARDAESLAALDNLRLALVSGLAAEPGVLERMRVQHGFALTNLPSAVEILAAVEATGAREVALFHGGAEPLAALLRERGLDAYARPAPANDATRRYLTPSCSCPGQEGLIHGDRETQRSRNWKRFGWFLLYDRRLGGWYLGRAYVSRWK